MKITVIGTGYVGLTQGVCLAHLGHNVDCVDVAQEKVDALNRHEAPIYEAGLQELLDEGLQSQRLKFTTDFREAIASDTDIVFVGVQTPQAEDGSCDLSFIEKVLKDIGSILATQTIVVIKSTVPPGTREQMHEWLGNPAIELAANPEFLRQGKSIDDFLHPDRIVVGVESKRAAKILEEVHRGIEAPIFVVSVETAQLVKYAANAMLASRLSFINEIAKISDKVGADIKAIEKLVGLDHRIGEKYLGSSIGFGGGCLPKDTQALCFLGDSVGAEPDLLHAILSVNKNQPKWFMKKIVEILGDLSGQKLAVWGLSFNKGTDDVRFSLAMDIVEELVKRGAQLTVYDPQAIKNARVVLGDRVDYANSAIEALDGADGLFVLTEWPEFAAADWDVVKEKMKRPVIFDAKHFLPHQDVWQQGFEVYGIGLWRPKNSAEQ